MPETILEIKNDPKYPNLYSITVEGSLVDWDRAVLCKDSFGKLFSPGRYQMVRVKDEELNHE